MKRMHGFRVVLAIITASILLTPNEMNAQDEEPSLRAEESQASSPFSAGGDLVSSYLWRGTKFGTGPAIQPYLELALGNFSMGGWGSYCFTTNEGAEADLYISYGFDFGLSIGMTDYYFPGTEYFDFSTENGAHALEINLGYAIGGLSFGANYFINEAGGAGTAGGDMYFELEYSFDNFGLVLGGGNGWHTPDGEFMVCNVGVTTSKEIKISESSSLPVSGAIILNPAIEQFHIVVGVSF